MTSAQINAILWWVSEHCDNLDKEWKIHAQSFLRMEHSNIHHPFEREIYETMAFQNQQHWDRAKQTEQIEE